MRRPRRKVPVNVSGKASRIEAVVFDFDGVILESLDIKARAFQRLFEDYPEHQERILQLHLQNTGVSRFEKFKIIYRDFLKLSIDESVLEDLGRRFSHLVFQEVLECPFVQGAYEFLEKRSSDHDLFVASATPQDELCDIVEQRRLSGFFRGVYGTPRTKAEILHGVLRRNGFSQDAVVFIGDALSDYAAARENSVAFIGRVPSGTASPFPNDGVLAIVHDLRDLDLQWDERIAGVGV